MTSSFAAALIRIALIGTTMLSPVFAAGATAAGPNVTLPESVNISYRLTSSLTDGIASLAWKREGTRYNLESSIEAKGFFSLVGALRQSSRGDISAQGLQPAFFSIKRGDGMADTANFNRDGKELKLFARGENKVMPLPPGLQDTLSFLFQLPYDMQALKNDSDRLIVMASNARKIYRHEFLRVGDETLQTAMGPLKTVHLKSMAADPEDVYEVWLAPENFYLPVKLKFFAGRFLIEQTVTSISTGG
ncbi:MAG TPA: DUF3108 domain-containing protein [Usitatibacteraceae bacterium]